MSDSGAGVPWSSEQLSWLQALGHTVYVDRAQVIEAPVAAAETAEAAPWVAANSPAQPRSAPSRRAPAPMAEERVPGESAASPAGAPASRRGRLPDRLQLALLRASGLNPADPATQAVMETWPLAELRASPQAKRALWPQLRALRRRARGRGA